MKFNKEEQQELMQNKNVLAVTDTCVYYTQEFKEQAIQEYYQGKTARQIFIDAGFNLEQLSKQSDYASKILGKWRKSKNTNNIHYPKKKIKETQSAYQKLLARNEYLEAENEFLKKLQALNNQFK